MERHVCAICCRLYELAWQSETITEMLRVDDIRIGIYIVVSGKSFLLFHRTYRVFFVEAVALLCLYTY